MVEFEIKKRISATLLKPIFIDFVCFCDRKIQFLKRKSVEELKEWISEKYPLERVIYMGDGIFDHYVFKKVGFAIATSNSDILSKKFADYITNRNGGDRAVAEACLKILEKFFEPYNPDLPPQSKFKLSGEWTI